MKKQSKTPEELELEKIQMQEQSDKWMYVNGIKQMVYRFLEGYKQNPGIFVNNFLAGKSFEEYMDTKLGTTGLELNESDNPSSIDIASKAISYFGNYQTLMDVAKKLYEREQAKVAYYPITFEYMRWLIAFAECMELMPPIEFIKRESHNPQIALMYVPDGSVSEVSSAYSCFTNPYKKTAKSVISFEQEESIHGLVLNNIRPKKTRKNIPQESEIILPPFTYEKIRNVWDSNESIVSMKQLDLLRVFYERMQNPPAEYMQAYGQDECEYNEAMAYLKAYLDNHQTGDGIIRKRSRPSKYEK